MNSFVDEKIRDSNMNYVIHVKCIFSSLKDEKIRDEQIHIALFSIK